MGNLKWQVDSSHMAFSWMLYLKYTQTLADMSKLVIWPMDGMLHCLNAAQSTTQIQCLVLNVVPEIYPTI